MKGKAAVLGSPDFVMPYRALGLDTYDVEPQKDQVIESAQKILKENYTLVVVAENVAKMADEVFYVKDRSALPCVVVVPFTTESEGFATEALGHVLKMATGIDIIQ